MLSSCLRVSREPAAGPVIEVVGPAAAHPALAIAQAGHPLCSTRTVAVTAIGLMTVGGVPAPIEGLDGQLPSARSPAGLRHRYEAREKFHVQLSRERNDRIPWNFSAAASAELAAIKR